jgi:hypothetical protein
MRCWAATRAGNAVSPGGEPGSALGCATPGSHARRPARPGTYQRRAARAEGITTAAPRPAGQHRRNASPDRPSGRLQHAAGRGIGMRPALGRFLKPSHCGSRRLTPSRETMVNQIGLTCAPLSVNAEAHRFMPNGKYLRTGHRPAPVTEHDPILSPACRQIAHSAPRRVASGRAGIACKSSSYGRPRHPRRLARAEGRSGLPSAPDRWVRCRWLGSGMRGGGPERAT